MFLIRCITQGVLILPFSMRRFTPDYTSYLKSPRWQAKRDMYFSRYGRYCKACGKIGGHIVLHHMTYEHLGNEPMADLVALCNDCHVELTKKYRRSGTRDLRQFTMRFIKDKKAGRAYKRRK